MSSRRSSFPGAEEFVPPAAGLGELAAAVNGCRGCDLFEDATQAVFGAGREAARVVLVGEQPGDQEDRRGEPFVGPAGRLLDEALEEAGIARDETYVTNAVKHFRFEQAREGSRRIHKKPGTEHVRACAPWLAAELDVVEPDVVVGLGATAAQAMLGASFRVTKERGVLLPWAQERLALATGAPPQVLATIHPSAVLRSDDRAAARAGLVADLRVVADALT